MSLNFDNAMAVPIPVQKYDGGAASAQADLLAVEEPLEIRLGFGPDRARCRRTVSVTMRTPGHDEELAAGFLWAEGILTSAGQIRHIHACGPPNDHGVRNVVRVELRPGAQVDLTRLDRHFTTTSSCGICGKSSLAAVQIGHRTLPPPEEAPLAADLVSRLPDALRVAQATFDRTGGLHAAGLFDLRGTLLRVREDVGRHNAVDKLIGAELLAGSLPLSQRVLLLSGRASFELVQKAMLAGIPILAAVGAPSSLAVDLARACGMTVLGFVRGRRFNVYTVSERIRTPPGV